MNFIKWKNTFCYFKGLSENKGLEIQLTLQWGFANWFELSLRTNTKCDHAGTQFTFELLKFLYFHISVYDFRHWDYDNDRYEVYE